jgi:Na+/H+ antiporter NhaD/arsenite permease-like protein
VLIATDRLDLDAAWQAIDVPTMALLLGLMVVSAQLRLGGFYTATVRWLGGGELPPAHLLAWLVVAAGVLSAVLANDIVCLAMSPVVVELCGRRRLDPVPFLLGLALASNVGSAATLIGNPQNMLIGEVLRLSFARYLLQGGIPAVLGLGVVWAAVWLFYRNRWVREVEVPPIHAPVFDRWQSGKGVVVVLLVVAAFLWAPWPREVVALAAAGLLLISRQMASREMLGLVDWHLLLLFAGLFCVNAAVQQTGMLAALFDAVRAGGIDVHDPAVLFGTTAILSNVVSNVPAVMLLLPAATHDLSGPVLALSSTLAGNLFIVGSIANIIVVDRAAALGVKIDWRTHARIGVPVTLGTLALAAAWLCMIG